MLYDPKWEQKTETKPSLAGLIAWLERQPADTRYDWMNALGCVMGQYLRATRMTDNAAIVQLSLKLTKQEPFQTIALGGLDSRYTFGAALERARAAL